MNNSNLIFLLTFLIISLFSSECLAQNETKEINIFKNDSIKLTNIKKPKKQAYFNEANMIEKIEDVLSEMDYNIISQTLPIKTDEYEAFKISDTIKFFGIRLKIHDTPVLVRHDISLDKLNENTIQVWLKSFVLVKPSDSQITIDEATDEAKEYFSNHFQKDLKRKIRKVLRND